MKNEEIAIRVACITAAGAIIAAMTTIILPKTSILFGIIFFMIVFIIWYFLCFGLELSVKILRVFSIRLLNKLNK